MRLSWVKDDCWFNRIRIRNINQDSFTVILWIIWNFLCNLSVVFYSLLAGCRYWKKSMLNLGQSDWVDIKVNKSWLCKQKWENVRINCESSITARRGYKNPHSGTNDAFTRRKEGWFCMNYIRITKENIDREHICCAMSGKQSITKKEWLKDKVLL